MRGEEFQGHTSLKLEVLGFVDDTHAAVSDLVDDLVFAGDEHSRFQDAKGAFKGLGEGGVVRASLDARTQRRRAAAAEPQVFLVLSMALGTFHGNVALPDV